MTSSPRDLYLPADSWMAMVDTVAPAPRDMEPAFSKALEQFERYSVTIGGEIGDSIKGCHKHLDNFLKAAQETISAESGENSARLGRPRDVPHGNETLIFQVFNYNGEDSVSIREDRLATLLTGYDLFRDTMRFMDKKVEEGDLGLFKNSFLFIHKPLQQAAEVFDRALEKLPVQSTTQIGEVPNPQYVHVAGIEPSDEVEPGRICRVLKPGYAFENREIQEGVVIAAESRV